ncbi:MAG: right-handed parallel beta-helix repeat-containing protein [Candidatus Bathyarchaeia archaeon]|nr:right-handed parallel beta-helix repeat-containing protein [Candidatus Bathyarchaeia archaeon]
MLTAIKMFMLEIIYLVCLQQLLLGVISFQSLAIDNASVQSLIDSAPVGGKVLLKPGKYVERLHIDKPIHLLGFSSRDTIIEGDGTGNVITINSDNVILESITICGSGKDSSGIYMREVSNVSIVDCIIRGCYVGLKADMSKGINITNCVICSNELYGARILGVSNNIYFYNNTIYSNIYGICLFTFSENNIVSKNLLFNNSIGLALINSQRNLIILNKIYNNVYALYLEDRQSVNNTVIKNDICNNTYGVYINIFSPFAGNLFYSNNFINNIKHVTIEAPFFSSNYWNLSYPIGGNYWGGLELEDLNRGMNQNITGSDGFGDNPFYVAENNIDYYPLMNPYKDVELSSDERDWYTNAILAVTAIVVVNLLMYIFIKKLLSGTKRQGSAGEGKMYGTMET